MDENAQDPNVLHLSRFGLTIFLAVIVLLPIAMLIFLWVSLPAKAENGLQVSLLIKNVADDQPALILTNESDEPLRNIGISLNDAFHFYNKTALEPGKELTVALRNFARKGGIPFSPDDHILTEVGVYAKLPNNSRGVFEVKSEKLLEDLQKAPARPSKPELPSEP
ncbi:hypothetical protein [Bremerella cremea]|uniref:hypothetical protein n=1 Tax=Bremerella cremea TaxID=1031537 RepID=UPI0031E73572